MFTVEIHTFGGYVFKKEFKDESLARRCYSRMAPMTTKDAGGIVIENVRLWQGKGKSLLADAKRDD